MSLWTDFLGAQIRFVDTPTFGRVRIAEAGGAARESLLLLHGIGGHLEAYARNVVALSERFRVIAMDFIGHGLSAKPVDIDYGVDAYVTQVRELMDTLGIERAHLSGESMGGAVAGHFAVRHPERIGRLVLNTTGGIPVVSEQGRQDARNLAELTARNVGKAASMESVRARMQWLLYERNWPLLTDELVGTRLALYQRPDFQASAPRVYGNLMKASGTAPIELERLACDTMLLWTRFNPIHDLAAAQAALPRIARGSLYVMKADCGHWPQYESPDEFNAVVAGFLESGSLR